jgi:hypothetical protein
MGLCDKGENRPESIELYIEDQAFSWKYDLVLAHPLSIFASPVSKLEGRHMKNEKDTTYLRERGQGVGEEPNQSTAR